MTPPFLAGGLLSSAWQSNFSLQIPFGKIPSRQDSLASQDVLPLIDSETSRAGQRKWIAVKRQIDDESSGIHVLRNLDSVYLSAVWLWIHVYKTSHILLDLNMETIAIFVIKKWGLFQICRNAPKSRTGQIYCNFQLKIQLVAVSEAGNTGQLQARRRSSAASSQLVGPEAQR